MEAKRKQVGEIPESLTDAAPDPVKRERPVRERRDRPRVLDTPPAPPPPPRLNDYEAIVGKAELDELHFLAKDLRGKTMKMVNSTAVGGGVAEMLNRLVPLLQNWRFPPTGM